MHVTELTLRDFKGVLGSTPVGRKTLLVGPNGSGKTARLQALTFAITGSTPLGEKPEATQQLGGHRGCGVIVRLDDGMEWSRSIRKDAKRKTLSTEIEIGGAGHLGVKEADAAIREKCGAFAPMFNLGKFLDLSDDKRRDFVLNLCARARGGDERAIDADDLLERITLGVIEQEIGEATVALQQQKKCTLEDLMRELSLPTAAALRHAVKELRPELAGDLTAAIAATLDAAKAMANSSKQAHDRAVQAGRKLSEQKVAVEVVAATESVLEQQLTDLAKQREELIAQLNHQRGRGSAKAALGADMKRLATELAATQNALAMLRAEPTEPMEDAERLEREADEIDGKVEDAIGIEACQQARDVCREQRDEAKIRYHDAHHAIEQNNREIERLLGAIKEAEADPWRVAHKLAQNVDLTVTAPEVLRSNPAWGKLTALLAKHAEADRVAVLQDSLAKQQDATRDLKIGIHDAADWLEECEKALAGAELALKEAEAERCAAWKRQEDRGKRAAALRADATRIRINASSRVNEIGRLEAEINRKSGEQIDKERRLNELLSEAGDVPEDQLLAQIESVASLALETQHQIKARQQYATLDAELTRCIASAEAEETTHRVCKLVVESIKSLREELMQELVAPLIGHINRFLRHAAPGREAYCTLLSDRGKPVFELGWIVEGKARRAYAALSDGEKGVFGCGLALALVCLADPPLRLLMLEASAIDGEAMARVFDGLDAVADELSNIIVATHDTRWLASPSDWSCIALDTPETTVEVAA